MTCIPIRDGFLCVAGKELKIEVRGRVVLFEMHPYCGPLPLDKRTGQGRSLSWSHPFWHAVTEWCARGQKVGEDGLCVWRDTKTETGRG